MFFKTTDKDIFKKLGRSAYIRNGVGYGFVSDKFLYDNGYIELGIGKIISGRGDWGGGFEYASGHALKMVLDKNYIIKKIWTSAFYNSPESQKAEKIADKIVKKLKVGSKFIVKDKELKKHIDGIFAIIPCKNHIGHNPFESPHMLEHFTDPEELNCYSNFEDPEFVEYKHGAEV